MSSVNDSLNHFIVLDAVSRGIKSMGIIAKVMRVDGIEEGGKNACLAAQFIPRRTHLVTRERILRRTTLRNDSAVELLDRDSFWGGHCALVRRTIGRD